MRYRRGVGDKSMSCKPGVARSNPGFSFLEFSRKTNIFWGVKILWIFFWGHHKIGLYLEVISMHFKVFS